MDNLKLADLSNLLSPPEKQFPLDEVIANDELAERPSRATDFKAEAEGLVELSEALADSPNEILQKLSDVAMRLCGSDSAGVSIAESENGTDIFRWRGIAGQLKPFLLGTMPRDFSPCGHVLKTNSHQLMVKMIGHYHYVSQLNMPLHEVLLVPFKSNGVLVGTIWAVAHTPEKKFDSEDLRILKSLSRFASAAYRSRVDAIERTQIEDRLNMALEAANLGFWSLNLKTRQVTLSDRLLSDWGITNFDARLESVTNRVDPRDQERMRNAIAHAIEAKTKYDIKYRVQKSADQTIWIRAQGSVKSDKDGTPLTFTGTSLDITEHVRAETALEEAKEAAEQANETKSSFLANMSHEIRTPLGAILGFTDLLLEKDLAREERNQFLEIIARNGRSLTRIIDDILDLAKVEAGKIEIEKLEISLADLVNDVMDLFRENIKTKGIFLQASFGENVPAQVLSDPTRLRQILINIVGNAVKFTNEGGISLKVVSQKLESDHAKIEISVTDSGIGISDEVASSLFQPFNQGDNSTTRKFGGTGLGLALSRRLANALGGTLEIRPSNETSGTCFVISFVAELIPLANTLLVKNKTPKNPNSEKSLRLKGANILLAEDSMDNQSLLKRLLTRHGAHVEAANNGLESYRLAMAGKFDIILMDLQMPEMDGYEATRALREAGFKKPIIALTAHAMAEERALTMAAGCNGHLTKPFDFEAIISTIAAEINK